jgi:hypothetical protein
MVSEELQCSAQSESGEPCKRPRWKDQPTCYAHSPDRPRPKRTKRLSEKTVARLGEGRHHAGDGGYFDSRDAILLQGLDGDPNYLSGSPSGELPRPRHQYRH